VGKGYFLIVMRSLTRGTPGQALIFRHWWLLRVEKRDRGWFFLLRGSRVGNDKKSARREWLWNA